MELSRWQLRNGTKERLVTEYFESANSLNYSCFSLKLLSSLSLESARTVARNRPIQGSGELEHAD
eukprot:9702949-Alexandrium_andersonii.AAC.1